MDTIIETVIAPRIPIAIVRLDDLSTAVDLSRALLEGGITAVEFTLTNHRAAAAISEVRDALGDALRVGAGTVLSANDAQAVIDAGAQFLVTPTVELDVLAVANRAGIPTACGALTPTEMLTAWRGGAQLVKVFPARAFGPAYIKDVLAPLPQLRLVPTGGVSLENCAAFLAAGAYTVALGSNLVDATLIAARDWRGITALARRYVEACAS